MTALFAGDRGEGSPLDRSGVGIRAWCSVLLDTKQYLLHISSDLQLTMHGASQSNLLIPYYNLIHQQYPCAKHCCIYYFVHTCIGPILYR